MKRHCIDLGKTIPQKQKSNEQRKKKDCPFFFSLLLIFLYKKKREEISCHQDQKRKDKFFAFFPSFSRKEVEKELIESIEEKKKK